MTIGICDDDKNWCAAAGGLIFNHASERQLNVEILIFHNSEDLLKSGGGGLNVIFLNVDWNRGKNGIALAEVLKRTQPNCRIVFLAERPEGALDIFQAEPIYFVMKSQFEKRLPHIFEKIMHAKSDNDQKILFLGKGGRQIQVRPSDIYVLEREMRQTTVYTTWGDFHTKEKLDMLLERLPKIYFSRCHHSYIIYFPAVREKRPHSYIMDNGREIFISRGYYKQTREDWTRWLNSFLS